MTEPARVETKMMAAPKSFSGILADGLVREGKVTGYDPGTVLEALGVNLESVLRAYLNGNLPLPAAEADGGAGAVAEAAHEVEEQFDGAGLDAIGEGAAAPVEMVAGPLNDGTGERAEEDRAQGFREVVVPVAVMTAGEYGRGILPQHGAASDMGLTARNMAADAAMQAGAPVVPVVEQVVSEGAGLQAVGALPVAGEAAEVRGSSTDAVVDLPAGDGAGAAVQLAEVAAEIAPAEGHVAEVDLAVAGAPSAAAAPVVEAEVLTAAPSEPAAEQRAGWVSGYSTALPHTAMGAMVGGAAARALYAGFSAGARPLAAAGTVRGAGLGTIAGAALGVRPAATASETDVFVAPGQAPGARHGAEAAVAAPGEKEVVAPAVEAAARAAEADSGPVALDVAAPAVSAGAALAGVEGLSTAVEPGARAAQELVHIEEPVGAAPAEMAAGAERSAAGLRDAAAPVLVVSTLAAPAVEPAGAQAALAAEASEQAPVASAAQLLEPVGMDGEKGLSGVSDLDLELLDDEPGYVVKLQSVPVESVAASVPTEPAIAAGPVEAEPVAAVVPAAVGERGAVAEDAVADVRAAEAAAAADDSPVEVPVAGSPAAESAASFERVMAAAGRELEGVAAEGEAPVAAVVDEPGPMGGADEELEASAASVSAGILEPAAAGTDAGVHAPTETAAAVADVALASEPVAGTAAPTVVEEMKPVASEPDVLRMEPWAPAAAATEQATAEVMAAPAVKSTGTKLAAETEPASVEANKTVEEPVASVSREQVATPEPEAAYVPSFTFGQGVPYTEEEPRKSWLRRLFGWLFSSQSPARRMRLVETIPLGEKRFAAILRVDGREFLVGGSPAGITLLSALEPEGMAGQMRAVAGGRVADIRGRAS